jgi:hypothetical protein
MKVPFALLALALIACQSRTREGQPPPSPKVAARGETGSAAGAALSQALSAESTDAEWAKQVESIINPERLPYYTGPVGSIRGKIRIKGDPPPLREGEPIPVGKCFDAHKSLKSLFRVGPQGEVADVLVAATGYQGVLPPLKQAVTLEARGCAYSQQTAALMFGQDLATLNLGPEAVSPHLVGSPTKVMRFAVPGGMPTPVRPQKPGHYLLLDRSNPFNSVQVYVLNYPTVSVSDTRGDYVISGIPVGEVTLNALLPSTSDGAEQKVTVVAGQTVEVNLELTFNLADYQVRLKSAAAAPSATL